MYLIVLIGLCRRSLAELMFLSAPFAMLQGKRVLALEFETYEVMALKEMKKIAEQAFEKWPLQKILIDHRTGRLHVGEIAVIIAVAAAHRDAAFQACRYIIDTLKQTVPIWKKETFEDGEVWVAAHA
ncbi:MAG: molybdenum cofactor biosynthesis protein MoaE [Mucilaginibacter sp.]|jgi:molybdopterin synthase catalytic subunit|uniref:molybdenum cofactor biosynthesis protein MoaE n=1 Tax=Mucilaginibacter sp. TaxID=1882438 RepID=UPI003561FEFA